MYILNQKLKNKHKNKNNNKYKEKGGKKLKSCIYKRKKRNRHEVIIWLGLSSITKGSKKWEVEDEVDKIFNLEKSK